MPISINNALGWGEGGGGGGELPKAGVHVFQGHS